MAETKTLALGMLVLLALAGTTYMLTDINKTYYCEDKNSVAMCDKLSVATLNISSRCYYNGTKYFSCATGWKPIKDFPEVLNKIQGINITNTEEPVNIGPITTKKTITLEDKTFYLIETTEYGIGLQKILKCEIVDINQTKI